MKPGKFEAIGFPSDAVYAQMDLVGDNEVLSQMSKRIARLIFYATIRSGEVEHIARKGGDTALDLQFTAFDSEQSVIYQTIMTNPYIKPII